MIDFEKHRCTDGSLDLIDMYKEAAGLSYIDHMLVFDYLCDAVGHAGGIRSEEVAANIIATAQALATLQNELNNL